MKWFTTLILFFSASMTLAVETVDYVDVDQYLGRWYQIARNPMPFEPRDCTCAQQTLTARDDGLVGVYNSCNKGGPDGRLRDIEGTAENQNPGQNSKFLVDFNRSFKGTYWIIGLANDYSWSVVTDKRKRSLYILSKTPTLSDDQYDDALEAAAAQVRTNRLLDTDHTGCSYPD